MWGRRGGAGCFDDGAKLLPRQAVLVLRLSSIALQVHVAEHWALQTEVHALEYSLYGYKNQNRLAPPGPESGIALVYRYEKENTVLDI